MRQPALEAPLVETSGAVIRRAGPSPRYFAKCLAWTLTAPLAGAPPSFPLREPGWRQSWGYRVCQSR